jgi:hypothetical protein
MRARNELRGLLLFATLAISALISTSVAQADGMRCGTKLISDGDTAYQVQTRCGKPDQITQRTEKRTVSRWVEVPCSTGRCGTLIQDTIDVQVEEWLYDFGPQQLIRTVVFEAGHLIRVVTGGYGIKES